MNTCSVLFTIPRLVFVDRAGLTSDAPDIILVCQNVDQMRLIYSKILKDRKPRALVNFDFTQSLPILGLYLQVSDPDGLPLNANDIHLLCAMGGGDYQPTGWQKECKATQVIFGNGVELNEEEMNSIFVAWKSRRHFIICVGYREGRNSPFLLPDQWQPVVIGLGMPDTRCSDDPYAQFLNIVRSGNKL